MKAFFIFLVAFSMHSYTLLASRLVDPENPEKNTKSWVKAQKGMWQGGYKLWYKVDPKNKTVKYSHNRRKWKAAENAAWQDKQGNWLFIYQDKLMTNANGLWVERPDNSWQNPDGQWYRLTDSWELEQQELPDASTELAGY